MGALYVWGVVGKEVLIEVKHANNEQTIQWTGLGSEYDTLFLQCHDLTPSTSGVSLSLIYAEGSIPKSQTTVNTGPADLLHSLLNPVPPRTAVFPGGPSILILDNVPDKHQLYQLHRNY